MLIDENTDPQIPLEIKTNDSNCIDVTESVEATVECPPIKVQLPAAPAWFKKGRIQVPVSRTLKLTSHPSTITKMASYYQTRQLTDELVACYVQDQSEELNALVRKLCKHFIVSDEESSIPPAEPITESVESKANEKDKTDKKKVEKEAMKKLEEELVGIVNRVASRVNYGVQEFKDTADDQIVDLSKSAQVPKQMQVFKWEVELTFVPADTHAHITELRKKRQALRDEVNQFWDLWNVHWEALCELWKVGGGLKPLKESKVTKKNTTDDVEVIDLESTPSKTIKVKTPNQKIPKTPKTPKVSTKKKEDSRQKSITGFLKRVETPKTHKETVETPKTDFQRWFRDFTVRPNVALFKRVVPAVDIQHFDSVVHFDGPPKVEMDQLRQDFLKRVKKVPRVVVAKKWLPREFPSESHGWKLLQFTEDVRPPFCGPRVLETRPSIKIGRRYLFKLDGLDYEYDSEAEWEDEGEGEELGSEDEEDDEEIAEDIAEDDSKWVVPHGYLSDDEGLDADDKDSKKIGKEVDAETRKKRFQELTPVLVGPSWDLDIEGMTIQTLFSPQEYILRSQTEKEKVKKGVFPEFFVEPLKKFIEGQDCSLPKLIEATKLHLSSLVVEADGTVIIPPAVEPVAKEPTEQVLVEPVTDTVMEGTNEPPNTPMNPYCSNLSNRMIERVIKQVAIKEKRNSETKPRWHLVINTSS